MAFTVSNDYITGVKPVPTLPARRFWPRDSPRAGHGRPGAQHHRPGRRAPPPRLPAGRGACRWG